MAKGYYKLVDSSGPAVKQGALSWSFELEDKLMANRLSDVNLTVVAAKIDVENDQLIAVGMNKKEALSLLRKMWKQNHRKTMPLDRISFHENKIGNLFHSEEV